MRPSRVAPLAVVAVAALAVAVDPVAAQSTADSTTEELIWDLNNQLLYIAVPITILVEAILVYTVWKFRDNESPLPTQENRRLEVTWTVATAIILLFVGVASYQVLAQPYVTATGPDAADALDTEAEPLEVQVVGARYSWTFVYPEHDVSSTGTMVLPVDRPVRFNVTSTDWIHSMHVPGLGLKQDAFPGQSNYLLTKATDRGQYQLYCAEYCGVGHSDMLATVDVRSPEAFRDWLDESGPAGNETNGAGTATNGTATNGTASNGTASNE